MNIDEKIKQELENEAKQIDQILVHDPGLFAMLSNAFKGALGGWLILVGIITFIITLVMFWCGYQFFFVVDTATIAEAVLAHKLHWGVGLIISGMMVTALKMWTFMEMNRQSTLREIKRVELMIDKLAKKITVE